MLVSKGNKVKNGGILWDSKGSLVVAFSKEFGDLDVLLAKSLSLLFATQLCLRDGFRKSSFDDNK